VLATRTIVIAAIVGIGITLASVIVPSRKASRIPPVAAMRPSSDSPRCASVGSSVVSSSPLRGWCCCSSGSSSGRAAPPGSSPQPAVGHCCCSSAWRVCRRRSPRPVTRFIGWPIAKLFKVPGALARENVARAPRRTSSSASALMIGVALVSSTAVFASSLRATLVGTLESDLGRLHRHRRQLPGPLAGRQRNTGRGARARCGHADPRMTGQVDGSTKNFGAVDPVAFDKLVDPDLKDGTVADLGLNGLLLHEDPASDLDASVGSTIDVIFQNGAQQTLTVAGIYGDATFGNWLISLDTLAGITDAPARDFFVIAKLADGVDPTAGEAAVRSAMEAFPQADVQTTPQFLSSQEEQINQLLLIITMLLAFAILLAIMGISITLALGVFERTREIGLLRAVGMNKRQTRRSVRWEAVIVSFFGAIIGIVVGTFLGVVLSLAVPDDVIAELAFNPSIIVAILIGAVVAGLFAALYPSFKASNMNVLEAIATE
jgi:putative ABC transport system permease protein